MLIYDILNDDYDKRMVRAFNDHGITLRKEPISSNGNDIGPGKPYNTMQQIKESGFNTII